MEDFKDKYLLLKPKYEGLLSAIQFTMRKLIDKESVSLFDLDGRVKTLESLNEKISRKTYSDPFEDVEDMCGLRVICFYISDLDVLSKLIHQEFNVISESDKQRDTDADRFGYQSRHYILKLKDEWLSAPLYKDYANLKFEIQIRTMLMHSWAAISHKLLYKNENDAPKSLTRKLNRLSALIELADEEFNAIKQVKLEYSLELEKDQADKNVPINVDGLISIVNKYSPDRTVDPESISEFITEIQDYKITLADFESRVNKALHLMIDMERHLAETKGESLPIWNISGFSRVVMDITSDEYYIDRWEENVKPDLPSDSVWQAWKAQIELARLKLNNMNA